MEFRRLAALFVVVGSLLVFDASAAPESHPQPAVTAAPSVAKSNVTSNATAHHALAHAQHISPEAVAFLGFVAVCLILLIIFFMYLNKMFCFKTIGGFPCVDRPPKKRFDATTGREYGLAEEDEDDDCDSEDDAVVQFQRHKSIRMSIMQANKDGGNHEPKLDENSIEMAEMRDDEESPNAAASAVAAAVDALSDAADGKGGEASDPVEPNENQPILPVGGEVKDMAVEIGFRYFSSRGELTINVMQAKNTPTVDAQYQIHVAVLPSKKFSFRTNYEKGENPTFLSLFTCRIAPEILPDTYIRLRIYARTLLIAPPKLVGAAIVSLATLPKDTDVSRWTRLQPSEDGVWAVDVVENQADQQSSLQSSDKPTLEVGLAYSALTGRLAVEIGQAQVLNKLLRQVPPKLESYVKILIMLGPTADKLLAQTKTRLNKGLSPCFKEKFVFQVAQFQLSEVSIGIMVYTRRRENIGWIAIGSVGESTSSESNHWLELRSAAAAHSPEMITKIHSIRPPEKAPKTSSRKD